MAELFPHRILDHFQVATPPAPYSFHGIAKSCKNEGVSGSRAIEGTEWVKVPDHSFTCVQLTPMIMMRSPGFIQMYVTRPSPRPAAMHRNSVYFLPYARFHVDFCERKHLSIIAWNTENQGVIDFILCSGLVTDGNSKGCMMKKILSHFHETVAAINELETSYFDRETTPRVTVMHVFQLGVTREFHEQSDSTTPIHRALVQSRQQGYSRVIADSKSTAPCRSFELCGFDTAGSLSYDAISMNGTHFLRA